MLDLLANVLIISMCVSYFGLTDKWYFYVCLALYCFSYTFFWIITKLSKKRDSEIQTIKDAPIQTKFGEHTPIQNNQLPEEYLKMLRDKTTALYEEKIKKTESNE
jgi:Ca2+/Na+ antiporter